MVLRTTDGGSRWTRQSIGAIAYSLHAVDMTNPDTVYGRDFYSRILRTTAARGVTGTSAQWRLELAERCLVTDANTESWLAAREM